MTSGTVLVVGRGSARPTAGAGALLSLRDVSKTYADGTLAVDGAGLEVGPGEIVAIVGPSGCGKSTLLRVVAGLAEASSGAVEVRSPEVGFVFQEATLLPWLTVRANLELPGRLARLPRAERARRASHALDLTGLREFERHLPRQLSGGMRMRASVARALTSRPSLFLLDEPFGALDEITRQRLDDELLALAATEGFAALLVTHSVQEAVYMADRVLVMSARPGRIVAEVPVGVPRPREEAVRYTPEFVEAARTVSAALRAVA